MPLQTIALFVLVALAVGGVIWVFVYPILSGERLVEKRQQNVTRADPSAVRAAVGTSRGPKVRREPVEESLNELELRQKKIKNLPLPMRIEQAVRGWSTRQFIIISAVDERALVVGSLVSGGG